MVLAIVLVGCLIFGVSFSKSVRLWLWIPALIGAVLFMISTFGNLNILDEKDRQLEQCN